MSVRKLVLDAKGWRKEDDFYDALFEAVGSPKWHGRNFNAIRDSIVGGHINQVEIPYIIDIVGLGDTPDNVKELVKNFCTLIRELRAEGHEVDASFQD